MKKQSILNLHVIFRRGRALIFFALSLLCCGSASASGYQIGVYYFPGWKDNQPGAPSALPWKPIKLYPEREPMLGWYNEGTDEVMRQQLDWMHSYGIDYVVFDWYYGAQRNIFLEHSLAAYMRAPSKNKVKFSILWANSDQKMPKSREDWQAMVGYWVKYYFPRPEFLLVEGKPTVFVFSADELKKQAETFGATTQELLDDAQKIARAAGFDGINFVAGTGANVPMISGYAKRVGYESFSTYNYHHGPNDELLSHSYTELDKGYREHWKRFAEMGNLSLVVPMTSGWDRRPWGGSKDPLHDNSVSTPEEFKKHIEAAKIFMDANPKLTHGLGVICCWNEFGEGSYIEPTKKYGFSYLEKVKEVFSTP